MIELNKKIHNGYESEGSIKWEGTILLLSHILKKIKNIRIINISPTKESSKCLVDETCNYTGFCHLFSLTFHRFFHISVKMLTSMFENNFWMPSRVAVKRTANPSGMQQLKFQLNFFLFGIRHQNFHILFPLVSQKNWQKRSLSAFSYKFCSLREMGRESIKLKRTFAPQTTVSDLGAFFYFHSFSLKNFKP